MTKANLMINKEEKLTEEKTFEQLAFNEKVKKVKGLLLLEMTL